MTIKHLKIYTSHLEQQLEFYREVLQLPVRAVGRSSFQVRIGYSVMELRQRSDATPYHIAFHIPGHQEDLALEWLTPRAKILQNGKDKIVDFPAWSARSVYFYDADQNILEFIARKNMFQPAADVFSQQSLKGISEIGMATGNVAEKFHCLNNQLGLEKYTGDYQQFCATGDDHGLFIIINKNTKDWIPVGDQAFSSSFEVQLAIGKVSPKILFREDKIEIL